MFYVVAPASMARYLEQQIHAHYPSASIEEVPDYNIFNKNYPVVSGTLRTKRKFIFPLKTYSKIEADPMNSVVNVLSKLEPNEGIALQYTVRSAKAVWHTAAVEVARKVHEGKTLREALNLSNGNPFVKAIKEIFSAAKPTTAMDKQRMQQQQQVRNTAMEDEMLKGIEEKNSKAGLDVNLRIIVSAIDKGKARLYLDNLGSAFGQYNYYEYGNSFSNKINTSRQKKLIDDFIYRRFDEKISFLLNTEELAGLYHFPLKNSETPNLLWLTAKHAPAPSNIPDSGIVLGQNIYRREAKDIKIKREDRRRHTYVIGKSGVGKSVLLAGMAIQDIINGEGVCVIDPHGDLIEDIISRIPPERSEDVIHFLRPTWKGRLL
jgi:hypothetical protein